jgi:hypothetical protein
MAEVEISAGFLPAVNLWVVIDKLIFAYQSYFWRRNSDSCAEFYISLLGAEIF